MTIEEHARSVDPSYGSQAHQREFLERMRRAQELNPCSIDHAGDDETLASGRPAPPCHRTSCYPQDTRGRMVGA